MPRVSIGLPVFNGEKFLAEALDSILAQTYDDFELIISDNASTDRTLEICQKYAAKDRRIRYYRQVKNIGAAGNYNRVFALANGEYFKWAAHDDVIAPTYLERCLETLDREPAVVLCFPGIIYIDEHGELLRSSQENLSIRGKNPAVRSHVLVNQQIKNEDIFWAIFGLIRREALRKTQLIGGFVASDQVLLIQLLLLGEFHQIPTPLYFRRDHPLASTRKQRTPHERMAWFDPEKKVRVVAPQWKLFREHLHAVARARLALAASMRCYYEVLRRFANEWRDMAGELKLVAAQIIGRTA